MEPRHRSSHADVVVVGAGSGGCAVVRRLVDAGLSVLLLEAGPLDLDAAIHAPERSRELIGSGVDYRYVTVEQPGLGGRRVICPRGKVLGGSSSINGMIHARGDRSDFDAWAYAGNEGWRYEDVLPLFKRSEDFDGGESVYRGVGGPLAVTSRYEAHPVLASFVEAAVEAGFPFNPDYNAESLDGASFIQLNVRDGKRQSAARAFLGPIEGAPNLTVLTDCTVVRLLIENGRCSGVEIVRHGQVESVLATHEVILAAGAIDSPKLLLLSGVGPPRELRAVGIEPVVDLPGVGKNLHDHFFAPVSYRSSRPTPPALPGLMQFHAHVFWRSRSGLPCADVQALLVHMPMYVDGAGHGFSPVPMLVRPASRGELRLASNDPAAPPLIDPRYLSCDVDLETLVAAVELFREVAAQDALRSWRGEELLPGPSVRTKQELRDTSGEPAPPTTTPSARARWASTSSPSSTPSSASTGSTGSALPTRRSCRSSRRPIRTRQR
jgi:choline dehydrogenase